MSGPSLNAANQLSIVTRLAEFCRYDHQVARHFPEPWTYMRDKLLQTEEPIVAMKKELLAVTTGGLLKELKAGPLTEDRYSDYKVLYEKLLSPGDFADVALNLTNQGGGAKADWLARLLEHCEPTHLFIEEARPPESRSKSWEKLVKELYERLGLDLLGRVLERKPATPKRRAMVLWRERFNTKEYCTVVHIPIDPNQTFTPFMLPRIEAVIAANLRFLNKYR